MLQDKIKSPQYLNVLNHDTNIKERKHGVCTSINIIQASKMKTIAFYLPQFHRIPENDEWWGEGFTEWVNVKKAKPLFEGHIQPRIPLNNNYYDLSNVEVIKKQANMAMEYGINAFCFYHYWFDGHKLLEKPVETFLDKTDINIEYCLSWANEHWTNGWVSSQENILIEQRYGGKKEWKEHFDYLLPFFQDKRYIKEDNKPFFIIYRPEIIDCLNEMLDYWNELAKEAGFSGMCYAYQFVKFDLLDHKDDSRFTYDIEYQPIYAMQFHVSKYYDFERKVKRIIDKFYINIKVPSKKVRTRDYDDMWQYIINSEPISNKSIPGAFVNWDNTPRKGKNGIAFVGATPEKFEKYMTLQIQRTKEVYNSEYLFLFAWNEWAEGGFIEPDERFKDGYLCALKNALINNKEFHF